MSALFFVFTNSDVKANDYGINIGNCIVLFLLTKSMS